jgi:transposase-like protein
LLEPASAAGTGRPDTGASRVQRRDAVLRALEPGPEAEADAVAGPESPAANAKPKPSNASAALPTPGGLFWVNSRPPVVVSPVDEPGSTLAAPASTTLPAFSNGAPTARSANVSVLKSPAANSKPKASPVSAALPTWVNVSPCPASLGAGEPGGWVEDRRGVNDEGTVALAVTQPKSKAPGMSSHHPRPAPAARSPFAGFRFPPDVIVPATRWYLRFGLSYRDVEELLIERGVEVDHVTVYRWVQRFTPLLAEAARPCRHRVGDRWQVDETYVKVAGQWRYVYRAIDQFGQVIDVLVSRRRDANAARRFFERAIATTKVDPVEVVTDRAATYPVVLDELLPAAWHRIEQYANNRVECDHGRLKARLRPMRGLKQDHSARVIIAGHAFVQNVRRGQYELATQEPVTRRVMVAFDELAIAI